MHVYDGNVLDKTNYVTDKFLKVNSCGFQNVSSDFQVVRKSGRVDYHILMVNGGECEAFFGGRPHRLAAGGIVVYAAGEEQRYLFKSGSSSLWCHFTGTAVKEILDSCGLKSGVYALPRDEKISDAFSKLIGRFRLPGFEEYANVFLLELIYDIASAAAAPGRNKQTYPLLPALTYLNANYDKNISVSELASKAGYSKSGFAHKFTAVTGVSVKKYQNEIRLRCACEMLVCTANPVSEIAYSCGFDDPLYFSRIFKKYCGVSPSEYRSARGLTPSVR